MLSCMLHHRFLNKNTSFNMLVTPQNTQLFQRRDTLGMLWRLKGLSCRRRNHGGNHAFPSARQRTALELLDDVMKDVFPSARFH